MATKRTKGLSFEEAQRCAMRVEALQLAQRIRSDNRVAIGSGSDRAYQAADVIGDARNLMDFITGKSK